MFKSLRIIADVQDVAMMGNTIEQGSGHFGITKTGTYSLNFRLSSSSMMTASTLINCRASVAEFRIRRSGTQKKADWKVNHI